MFTKILSATLALSLLTPGLAHADPTKRQWVGTFTILAGSMLMLASVEDTSSCPAGYTTHYFDDIPTQCSYLGRTYTNVTEQELSLGIAHPKMFAAGIGTVLGGILILTLPKKAKKYAPSISASPQGVTLSKTVSFR